MKNRVLLIAALFLAVCVQGAEAQKRVRDFGLFDHVGLGVYAGTTGAGFELGAPITNHLQLRAGYTFDLGMSGKFDVDYTDKGQQKETEVEAKIKMGGFHTLLDIFPSSRLTFHITTGFFLGEDHVLTAENTSPISGTDPNSGLEIGDYIVGFDNNGIAHAAVEVSKFRPYVGIGFGRLVPRKRVSFSFDLGAQLWGKPKVMGLSVDGKSWNEVQSRDVDKKDDGFIDIISSIRIYPVLTLRLSGRIL